MTEATLAHDRIALWKADPVQFVRDVFGAEPDSWQVEVLRMFPVHQRIAMKACKGPGKSTVLAWIIWNFLATRPFPKVACTSITADNLADGLWTELAKWRARSPFLLASFEWAKTRIVAKDHPEIWWCSARTWAKGADSTQQADALAGLHADYLLFVLDEAGGIPDAVMAAAEAGLATGIETKMIMAGNPTHLEGPLYRACTSERHLWQVIEITGDPDDPKRSPRISVQWAREQIQKYGRENPWVLVNVFGRFPPSSLNALLGPDDVAPCLGRHLAEDVYAHAARVLGVDVARFGDDRTVIIPRQGLACFTPVIMRNARTNEIAARIAVACQKWEPDAIFIDDTGGWGAGVIDSLLQAGYSPIPVNFSGKATDPRYLNKRAEMWFDMAEWVKTGPALPEMPELLRELCAPTYDFKNGKFQLEDKGLIKERLGESPDISDALALTFAQPIAPRRQVVGGIPLFKQRLATEFDPFVER